jgi:hypothetical protein
MDNHYHALALTTKGKVIHEKFATLSLAQSYLNLLLSKGIIYA